MPPRSEELTWLGGDLLPRATGRRLRRGVIPGAGPGATAMTDRITPCGWGCRLRAPAGGTPQHPLVRLGLRPDGAPRERWHDHATQPRTRPRRLLNKARLQHEVARLRDR